MCFETIFIWHWLCGSFIGFNWTQFHSVPAVWLCYMQYDFVKWPLLLNIFDAYEFMDCVCYSVIFTQVMRSFHLLLRCNAVFGIWIFEIYTDTALPSIVQNWTQSNRINAIFKIIKCGGSDYQCGVIYTYFHRFMGLSMDAECFDLSGPMRSISLPN